MAKGFSSFDEVAKFPALTTYIEFILVLNNGFLSPYVDIFPRCMLLTSQKCNRMYFAVS